MDSILDVLHKRSSGCDGGSESGMLHRTFPFYLEFKFEFSSYKLSASQNIRNRNKKQRNSKYLYNFSMEFLIKFRKIFYTLGAKPVVFSAN